MSTFQDLTGKTFTRLTVISRAKNGAHGEVRWNCECSCGKNLVVFSLSLKSNQSKSCGCLHKEGLIDRITTHGFTAGPRRKQPKEYAIWSAMKQRCHNKNANAFDNYGGRGIFVCDKWINDFHAFYQDMGKRPSKNHTIERINNSIGYSPDNCCWVTRIEQGNNRRDNKLIEYKSTIKTLSQWSHITRLHKSTLLNRLSRGWSVEKALFSPVQIHRHSKS